LLRESVLDNDGDDEADRELHELERERAVVIEDR